jgi:hypothetical protein
VKLFLYLTLAAKIRWRMKYDRVPLLTQLQDKLAVKKYAAERGVPSAEVLFVTQNPETIPFGDLPEKCFIKANHGRNWNILKYGPHYFDFRDGEKHISHEGFYSFETKDVKYLKPDEIIDICSEWLKSRYRPVEWAYNNIVPAVFVEMLIEPEPGKETRDYRLFTFSGKVAAISIGSPSMRKKDENIFFDKAWNKINLQNNFEKEPVTIPEKPAFLDKMIEAAGQLGKGLDFVRIDFFADHRNFYLSEMTIYPNGGQDNRPTTDQQFNLFLGRQWKMNPWHLLQAYWLETGYRKSKTL